MDYNYDIDIELKRLFVYQTPEGKFPYRLWYDALKDRRAQAAIEARLDRLLVGNAGDFKALKDGIFELRIHYGPGFRLYFAEKDETLILLLIGGDKSTQKQDIRKAKEYYDDYQTRSQKGVPASSPLR